MTTATRRLGEQLDSRLFSLDVPDESGQLRQALATQAAVELSGGQDADPALIAYQAYLQAQAPWSVVLPFVEKLADAVSASILAPRILRDFARLVALVKAVAVLRHPSHRVDAAGRVVATLDDYAKVYELVGDLYEASATGASANVRAVVKAVAELMQEGSDTASVTAIGARLGITKMSASRRAKTALKMGWLVNDEERRGRSAALRVGEPLPARTGLPHPDDLQGCNGVPPLTDGESGRQGAEAQTHSPNGHAEPEPALAGAWGEL